MRRLIDQNKRREQAAAWYAAYKDAKRKLEQKSGRADASYRAKSDDAVPTDSDSESWEAFLPSREDYKGAL